MRALLAGARGAGAASLEDFEVTIRANGQDAGSIQITDGNRDVHHLVSLTELGTDGENSIQIETSAASGLAYQIVGVHHQPHRIGKEAPKQEEVLSIETEYSATELAKNDELVVTATLRYQRPEAAPMTLVDFGLPPDSVL